MAEKKYEIVVVDGKELRQYPDGSVRDAHGHIRKMSPERARRMQKGRAVKGMILAGDAIQEATNSESVDEGVMKLVRKRLEVAMTDPGRAGNDAARWFLQMAGYLNLDKRLDVEVKHKVPLPTITEEDRKLMLEMLEIARRGEGVIDAEAEDVEPGNIYKE